MQFPQGTNKWYILQCQKHGLDFKDNPIKGAAAHLGSKKHGRMSREHAVVIEHLGVHVLGCDEVLAERNNAVARNNFLHGQEHSTASPADRPPERGPVARPAEDIPSNQTRRTRGHLLRDPRPIDGRQNASDSDAVVDPIPGQIYLGFWEKSKDWSPVFLLPTAKLADVGIPSSIEKLGLADNVPACYDYDRRSKAFTWRRGYEDGGRLVSQREFPVMYFDGLPFPDRSAVGWVAAASLRAFDIDSSPSSLTPNLGQVRKFLRERKEQWLAKSQQAEGSRSDETNNLRAGTSLGRTRAH